VVLQNNLFDTNDTSSNQLVNLGLNDRIGHVTAESKG
jgi:hypothetical protein